MLLSVVYHPHNEPILECADSHFRPITGLSAPFHHQMESQAEEKSAETQKERKLRERNEQYSRQLEEELERLKVPRQARGAVDVGVHVGPAASSGPRDVNASSSPPPS